MNAVLGTRGSDLALWQARHIQQLLQTQAGLQVRIEVIRTAGDRRQDISLAAMPGKGFFTKEIEDALLQGRIDLAVHSHKDLPTEQPPGLEVAAVPGRGSAAECLLVHPRAWRDGGAWPVRAEARVGTGSARRAAQIRAASPGAEIHDLRGNVPTRVGKLRDGQYDAIVLARAGLDRLGLNTDPLLVHEFPPHQFVPAPAQGALAVQIRSGPQARGQDRQLAAAVLRIHHEQTAACVVAERLLLAALEGGCQLPLGAYATCDGGRIRLLAVLAYPGGLLRRCDVTRDDPQAAAQAAYEDLTR
jgi:hydroxymethylbilane synthase